MQGCHIGPYTASTLVAASDKKGQLLMFFLYCVCASVDKIGTHMHSGGMKKVLKPVFMYLVLISEQLWLRLKKTGEKNK